jgi:hypothetical protein
LPPAYRSDESWPVPQASRNTIGEPRHPTISVWPSSSPARNDRHRWPEAGESFPSAVAEPAGPDSRAVTPTTAVAAASGPSTDRKMPPRRKSLADEDPSFFAATNRAPDSSSIVQATAHYRRAFALGNRGALFAARAELLDGVRTLAEGMDASSGQTAHVAMLSDALRALDEADDFAPRNGVRPSEADVARSVRSHRTPLLKDQLEGVSATLAEDRYLAYATEELAAAVGADPIGAELFHALGKTYGTLARQTSRASRGADGRALAYYQAALLVSPRHALAANDLAVALAQQGRWQANLGQAQLAAQSQQASVAAAGGSKTAVDPNLAPWLSARMMQPSAFAGTAIPGTDPLKSTSPLPAPAAETKPARRWPLSLPTMREARRPNWNN